MPTRRRPRRRTVLLAGAVAVAALGGSTWWLTRPEPASAQSATMTVTRETFKDTVSATGTVEPAEQADLSFAVSGTVTGVLVREGRRVRKGQVLATVDDTLLEADVTAKESAVDAAETRLQEDEESGASATQLAADRAALVDAEAQLAQAEEALAGARLRSSITGTVAAVELEVGDTVGSAQPDTANGEQAAHFTVVSSQRYVVAGQVATSDVNRVKKGLQAEITPTGGTATVYGVVQSVGRVATAQEDGAATFPVTIEVTGKRKDVYAGSSATVEIIVEQVDDVLAVPSMALRQDDRGTYVYLLVDGKRTRRAIETGDTYGTSTEVVSGLEEGDEVEVVSLARPAGGGGRQGTGPGGLPPDGLVFQQDGPGGDLQRAP